jgi:leucyl aminopeptidase
MSAPTSFDLVPSLSRTVAVVTEAADSATADVDAEGVVVGTEGDIPDVLEVDREALRRAGFEGRVGQALGLPRSDRPALVAVGIGAEGDLDMTTLRSAAAAFARAVPHDSRLAFTVPSLATESAADAAQAVVEGVLLARYDYSLRGRSDAPTAVSEVRLYTDSATDVVEQGAHRGQVIAGAATLARDLANCPGSLMTATKIADVAVGIADTNGLQVEVFDKDALLEMGCGGLLGVNQASAEPPRMVRLRYEPENPAVRLALVGKGIMYDSGGISLKPSDAVHATMKNDMTGAAAVLASMSVLRELGCRAAVTGYLMCTDNMPSGSSLKLGDVITMRGGRTVEVLNTDAEGRLVMADALVLATEEPVDAIVDIATLTGQCLRTLGTEVAGVMGTNQSLVDQVRDAAEATDEPVWQLPMWQRYRNQLDSPIADLTNLGGPNAGSITAALFLAEFVGDVPFVHIDIAGTAQSDAPRGWVNKGATGSGTRLLIDLALRLIKPAG